MEHIYCIILIVTLPYVTWRTKLHNLRIGLVEIGLIVYINCKFFLSNSKRCNCLDFVMSHDGKLHTLISFSNNTNRYVFTIIFNENAILKYNKFIFKIEFVFCTFRLERSFILEIFIYWNYGFIILFDYQLNFFLLQSFFLKLFIFILNCFYLWVFEVGSWFVISIVLEFSDLIAVFSCIFIPFFHRTVYELKSFFILWYAIL